MVNLHSYLDFKVTTEGVLWTGFVCVSEVLCAMAKGLLFALVRKGSKLNYLDETSNTQSEREGKVRYERTKSHSQASAKSETKENNNASKGNDSQHTTASKEGRRRRKKLFDLTLQKLSKGCKMNQQSPACSNNTILTENAFGQGDIRSVHRNKPMLVPSVASGYFVTECNSASKETISKNHEKNVPRIVLTDLDNGNISAACKSLENRSRVQYSRYAGSLPQLRTTRPSSCNGDSCSKLNDFTDRKSKTITNGLEAEQSPGFWAEAITISVSPSLRRKSLRSANSLDSKRRQLITTGSSIGRSEMAATSNCEVLSLPTKDHFVKRAGSWSRGDEKVNDFISARQNRKIDIFLPSM